MNRLLNIDGGQHLKARDWDFIQDATVDVIKSLVESLADQTGPVIIKGCEITADETNTYVAEGVIFDGDELRNVPSASFVTQGAAQDNPEQGTWLLYLTPTTTTGEQRTFKDTTQHDVWQYNDYIVGYAESVPEGSVQLDAIDRLNDLIADRILAQVPEPPAQVLTYHTKTIAVGDMDQSQIVIPKAGAGKVIKIVSITAKITPTTTIEADLQEIYVFYEDHTDTPEIGSFPNDFIESPATDICDMKPADNGRLYANSDVRVALSLLNRPTSGAATVKFYCIYKVITL